jgi:hypothetical protein
MQIGSADAYRLDPDLHFAGSGIFNRHVSKAEGQGIDEFCGSHRTPFFTNDTPSVGEHKRRDGYAVAPLRNEIGRSILPPCNTIGH